MFFFTYSGKIGIVYINWRTDLFCYKGIRCWSNYKASLASTSQKNIKICRCVNERQQYALNKLFVILNKNSTTGCSI